MDDDGRYLQRIGVVVGKDFRIGPGSESLCIDVVRAPTRDGDDVDAHSEGSCLWEFDDSYPADAATTPPRTRIDTRGKLPRGFTGVWRTGVMLDCGKDLPQIDQNGFGCG